MNIGVSYSAFEGTELLRYSIKQIRAHVSFVCLVYQKFSWYGHPILKKDLDEINSLYYDEKLVDKIYCFPILEFVNKDNSTDARKIEAIKRNTGRLLSYQNNCDYHLDLDVDEMYKENQFVYAKDFIEKNNIEYSAATYVNYYKLPIYQVLSSSKQRVPFICKIDPFKHLGESPGDFHIENISMGVDITRGVKTVNCGYKTYFFKPHELVMHHMLSVRKNLKNKFKVHSGDSPINKTKEQVAEEMLKLNEYNLTFDATSLYRSKEKICIVDNYFNIPLWNK